MGEPTKWHVRSNGLNYVVMDQDSNIIAEVKDERHARLIATTPEKDRQWLKSVAETVKEKVRADDAERDLAVIKLALRGVLPIAKERTRQITEEGWSREHDDGHTAAEMARAAAVYALLAAGYGKDDPILLGLWPKAWFDAYNPKGTMSNLVRAGALIAAEIDRIERAHETEAH